MNKKYKFFIVDDDRIFIKVLVKFLEAEGQTVLFNESSVMALPEIIEQKPDCVLLDMMMPEMDGLELLKKLRSEPD
ncbi:MAG: response regulator, partial [Thermodesulfobacteriota bacterium]|nr:response regulator [Thermodesulfobacteriota bacterium]